MNFKRQVERAVRVHPHWRIQKQTQTAPFVFAVVKGCSTDQIRRHVPDEAWLCVTLCRELSFSLAWLRLQLRKGER